MMDTSTWNKDQINQFTGVWNALLKSGNRPEEMAPHMRKVAIQLGLTAHHDGDLGHNSTVYYDDDPYSTATGETFYVKSVMISDKMRNIALIPKEALSLLAWLEQERSELEKLVKEDEG